MPRPRLQSLIEKSTDACIAAIEIYNKPSFNYREEIFSILILNAWELLLKARILQQNNNKMSSIELFEYKKTKNGKNYKRKTKVLTNSGIAKTIGIDKSINLVRNSSAQSFDMTCIDNIKLLKEIRDSSIHFFNSSMDLKMKLFQLGTASLLNYSKCIKNWFDVDFEKYNFYLMPLSFQSPNRVIEALHNKSETESVSRVLRSIAEAERRSIERESMYDLSLNVNLKFVRTSDTTASKIKLGSSFDADSIPVHISEEDIRVNYPLDYRSLTKALKARYKNFKVNRDYHKLRKSLETNSRYCFVRHLNPSNVKGSTMTFFSESIFSFFDRHYLK